MDITKWDKRWEVGRVRGEFIKILKARLMSELEYIVSPSIIYDDLSNWRVIDPFGDILYADVEGSTQEVSLEEIFIRNFIVHPSLCPEESTQLFLINHPSYGYRRDALFLLERGVLEKEDLWI